MLKKILCLSVSLSVFFTFVLNPAQAQIFLGHNSVRLPNPGSMVALSIGFKPPVLRGIKVYIRAPLNFDFILDPGDSHDSSLFFLKQQTTQLVKYFLTTLTIPDEDIWVNLSPYEKDRIITEKFGQTQMGRDLLAQDYLLKQITASLMFPDGEAGKKFWSRIYTEAQKRFGITQIPVNTFNKVWIMPDKAVIYEKMGGKQVTAFVVESSLKVMLEEDYLALKKHQIRPGDRSKDLFSGSLPIHEALNVKASQGNHLTPNKDTTTLSSQIMREVMIPILRKEVNEGENFAPLRQIYNSILLALWYKKKMQSSILASAYMNRGKIAGVNVKDKAIALKIWQRYVKAYKKGVFNFVKEDSFLGKDNSLVPRKYFAGGFHLGDISYAMRVTHETAWWHKVLAGVLALSMFFVASVGCGDVSKAADEGVYPDSNSDFVRKRTGDLHPPDSGPDLPGADSRKKDTGVPDKGKPPDAGVPDLRKPDAGVPDSVSVKLPPVPSAPKVPLGKKFSPQSTYLLDPLDIGKYGYTFTSSLALQTAYLTDYTRGPGNERSFWYSGNTFSSEVFTSGASTKLPGQPYETQPGQRILMDFFSSVRAKALLHGNNGDTANSTALNGYGDILKAGAGYFVSAPYQQGVAPEIVVTIADNVLFYIERGDNYLTILTFDYLTGDMYVTKYNPGEKKPKAPEIYTASTKWVTPGTKISKLGEVILWFNPARFKPTDFAPQGYKAVDDIFQRFGYFLVKGFTPSTSASPDSGIGPDLGKKDAGSDKGKSDLSKPDAGKPPDKGNPDSKPDLSRPDVRPDSNKPDLPVKPPVPSAPKVPLGKKFSPQSTYSLKLADIGKYGYTFTSSLALQTAYLTDYTRGPGNERSFWYSGNTFSSEVFTSGASTKLPGQPYETQPGQWILMNFLLSMRANALLHGNNGDTANSTILNGYGDILKAGAGYFVSAPYQQGVAPEIVVTIADNVLFYIKRGDNYLTILTFDYLTGDMYVTKYNLGEKNPQPPKKYVASNHWLDSTTGQSVLSTIIPWFDPVQFKPMDFAPQGVEALKAIGDIFKFYLKNPAMLTAFTKIITESRFSDRSGDFTRGGIDLTKNSTRLDVRNPGQAANFNIDPSQVAQVAAAPGLTPKVLSINRLQSLPEFLGMGPQE